MEGETLLDTQVHLRFVRLLCLVGAILGLLYTPLYGVANPGTSAPGGWGGLGVAGLLVVLMGSSYVSREVRRRHVEITWGLLCVMMIWVAAVAVQHEFAGTYAVGVLLVYTVFGGLVALGSASVRPVVAFLLVGALSVIGALLWTPSPQTNPWVLAGAVGIVALVEGAAARWGLSVRDRLRAQARGLREQQNRLHRFVQTSPHAVVRVDETGALIDANGRAEDLLGAGGEVCLDGLQDGPTGASARGEEPPPFSRVFRTGEDVRNRECWVERPDGPRRLLSVSGAPVRTANGEPREAVFHLEDVTAQKRRTQALQEAEEEAEEADRLKSALLANMSHEIRTPLTAIIGFAETIATKARTLELPANSPLPGYADLIEKSGKRLLDTFEGILDLAQLEAGEMTLSAEPVDLHDQARRAVETHRPDAQDHAIDLRLDGTHAEAQADEYGVQIVLQNLLDNAIKYTEEGGTVWVRTYLEPGWAVLEVKDTGVGMEPETVDQLFEPFRQASTGLDRAYEGTGIGLTVTKEAAEQMGGSIEVETEKGTGSRFLARLPMAASSAGDSRNGSAEPSEGMANSSRSAPKPLPN